MSKFIATLAIIVLIICACKVRQPITTPVSVPPAIADNPIGNRSSHTPKNIIFLIGDGMGLTQITLGMMENNNYTSLERYPVIGLHKPTASNKLITDSAAAATAFACGIKTYNGAIGVGPDSMAVKTILEMAEDKSMATGLVATSTIIHATPASFAAHNKYRKNYEEIAADMIDADVDVLIGGGKKYFERRESDNQNLLTALEEKNYYVSDFRENINDLSIDTSKNIAYFTADTDPLQAMMGRDYLLPATKFTLDYLKKKSGDNGFFTMIEGSQIDWGGHANEHDYVVSEYLDFDPVINYAYEWAKADGETLVVITADHETGGLAIQPESTPDSLVTAFTSTYHTGTMIPVFAFGPGSEVFSGIYENTAIFDKMVGVLGME